MGVTMKKRSQIKDKYKWNLDDIYSSVDELKSDMELLRSYPEKLASYKGKLGKKDKCLEYFKLNTELGKISEKVGVYVGLKLAENLEDSNFIELQSVLGSIDREISIATSFEESELIGYGTKYLNKLCCDSRFAEYKLALQDFIRGAEHVLPEEQEKLISKASKALGGYSDVFDNIDTLDLKFKPALDSKGKEHEVNDHNYAMLLESKDRTLRKSALESFTAGYHSLSNTIATNYIGSLEGDWFVADAYKYPSTLDMSLFGENIPKEVYTNLINSVKSTVKMVHKFYDIKKRALGYKDFYFYDRLVPITNFNSKKSYEENFDIVINAMSVLGEEYVEGLKLARDNRWIDVYPCEGKEGGGFCCSMYTPHPYILLNTVDDSSSISTLAHELGHAMHGYLSSKNQPFENYDHTIFLAEIASTVNEVLLFKYMYKNATSKNEKISRLEKYIGNIIATIYTQAMYSEYEYFAHTLIEKGEPISKDILNAKYKSLLKEYYGKSMKFLKEDIGEGWMRVPHFYRAYYVYKYATGMTSAINFAIKISAGDEEAKVKYLEFLKSGTKDYSINILKSAGVDLLTSEPYRVVEKELNWAIDELEKLLKLK